MKKGVLIIAIFLFIWMCLSGITMVTEEEVNDIQEIVENPVESVENPVEIVENPVESVENPPPTTSPKAVVVAQPLMAEAPKDTPVLTTTPESIPVQSYTDEELEILSIIIYQEAGGDAASDDTRRLVAQVFINRVNDDRFPDTFYDVATAERQYGTLYWTGIVWPDRASNPGEAHAVQRAKDIAKEVLESSEPYCPTNVIFQSQYIQGEIYSYQDGMYFCY